MTGQRIGRAGLGHRFVLLWAGETVNVVGAATGTTLVPLIAVLGLHAGPSWLGVLTAAGWLPWLIIGIPAGVIIDRTSPRAVMILANVTTALAIASVPTAAAFGRLGLIHLTAVAFLAGVCTVFFRSAYPVLLANLVPAADLERANARIYGSESASQAAGPGLAGLVTQVGSATIGLLSQVAGLVVSTACLICIGSVRRADTTTPAPVTQQIRDGFRHVYRDPLMRSMTLAGGVANFGHTGVNTLLIIFLTNELHLPPAVTGMVMTLGLCGGVLGAIVASRLARQFGSSRLLIMTQFGQLALIAIPLAHGRGATALVVAGIVLTSSVTVIGNVIRGAWRQVYIPRAFLGRTITVSQLINFGTMPVAALTAGILGQHLGLRPTLLIMVCTLTAAALMLRLGPQGRLRELPSRQMAEDVPVPRVGAISQR